jgi:hypothetical protein
MSTNATAYLNAVYPLLPYGPRHLSDEDIAAMLEEEERRSRAARKAAETRKRRAEAKKEATQA